MKPTIFSLFSLAAAAAVSSIALPSVAHAASDPTNDLSAIYSKTDSAADRKDVDGCLAYHSQNFMELDSLGKVETTDQERARLQSLFDSVGEMDVSTRIDKCDYADKTATVLITQHIKMTVTSPDSGKLIPVSGDIQARELWTKDSSGWKMDVAQTLTTAQLTPDE